MKRRSTNRGFTLMEVLLVILILGMLATVAIVALGGFRDTAKVDTTNLKLKSIAQGLDGFNMTMGRYPSTEEGLNALVTKPAFQDEAQAAKWHPFLTELPKDGWDHDFHYEMIEAASGTAQTSAGFHVWSDGPDGQSGTADDIKNWKDESSK